MARGLAVSDIGWKRPDKRQIARLVASNNIFAELAGRFETGFRTLQRSIPAERR